MTNQVQGETLFAGVDSSSGEWIYTHWIPVLGDRATFGIEILMISSSLTVTWNVETRSLDDPTVSNYYSSNQTTSAVGVQAVVPTSGNISSPAKELVRYRIATGATPSVSEWALLRALEPSWQFDRV